MSVGGIFGAWSQNGDLYSRTLGQWLRATRLLDPDTALSRDPEVYERLRLDPIISFSVRLRKLLSSGTEWWVEPASSSDGDRLAAKVFEEILKRLEAFTAARFNLAEAIIAGSRWAKLEGEDLDVEIEGLASMRWWVPTRMRDVDKRRFRQISVTRPPVTREVRYRDANGNETVATVPFVQKDWVWQIWRPVNMQWEDVDRDEYVRHVNDDREDTLGYGGGLASELYTYWYAKEVVLQYGLQYLERWAQGLVIAHVDSLRDGQASSPPSAQKMTDWLNVLIKLRSQHALVADAKDRVEVIDAPSGGWMAAMQALEYLDGSMRVCILGASLPTTKDAKGGSYAMAEIQQGVSDLLGRFDRSALEETLRRDLLGWIWRKNYANFCNLGLRRCTMPFLRIREDRREDHEIRANVLLKARQSGMAIRVDEAYAQLGFSPPAKTANGTYLDEVLPDLHAVESQRQAGVPKSPGGGGEEASGSMVPDDPTANPGRPGEVAGEAGRPREQGADALGRGFAASVPTT